MAKHPSSVTDFYWRIMAEAMVILFRTAPGFEVVIRSNDWCVLSGEPCVDLNCFRISRSEYSQDRFREFLELTRSRSLPAYAVADPAIADKVASIAEELVLKEGPELALMVADLERCQVAKADVEITRVQDESGHRAFCEVLAAAFSLPVEPIERACGLQMLNGPGVEAWLARRDSEAASTVLTIRSGDVIGIYAMGTPAAHQRKGIGQALLTTVLDHHRSTGARCTYLLASPEGYPLYRKIGYEVLETCRGWIV